MKATERLEELLDQKDARIEELETELQEANEKLEANWDWCRHTKLEANPDNLPVPRLEIRWSKVTEDGYEQYWDYRLIYRHLLGHLIAVPLGGTKTSGGNCDSLKWPNGTLHLPFRDGAHISHDTGHLGIPAFAIAGEEIRKLSMDAEGKITQSPV
jgi:hypothetical protein